MVKNNYFCDFFDFNAVESMRWQGFVLHVLQKKKSGRILLDKGLLFLGFAVSSAQARTTLLMQRFFTGQEGCNVQIPAGCREAVGSGRRQGEYPGDYPLRDAFAFRAGRSAKGGCGAHQRRCRPARSALRLSPLPRVYRRENDDAGLLVIANFYGDATLAPLPENIRAHLGDYQLLLGNYRDTALLAAEMPLHPYEAQIWHRRKT